MKVAGAHQSRKNACRNLTQLIKRTPGTLLPIPIDACKVHIRLRKPIRPVEVFWPVIKLSDWCRYFLKHKPELLLAGHKLNDNWPVFFRQFWADYRLACGGDHAIYSHPDWDLGYCIPIFLHGDEGRGQLKRPFMVIAWQCAVGFNGINTINDNTNIDCTNTHFVYMCLDVSLVWTKWDTSYFLVSSQCFWRGTPLHLDGSSLEYQATCTTMTGR